MTLSKWLSLLLLPQLLFSLELSVQSGKDASHHFSVIHLKEKTPFLCQSEQNDFDDTVEVVCAFERRPSELFKPLNNNFFTISAQTRGKNYFIVIKPHQKMMLYPVLFDLTQDAEVFQAKTERSRHWMIIGYDEELPMIKREKTPPQGFNFPVTFSHGSMPYVGGLDIKGNPVHMSRVKDVSDYLALKRFYRTGDYEKALELATAILENYPDTVFRSELMVYQMRADHHLDNSEELLEVAKRFLRTYSSDENVPEILAYTANAYAKMGLYIDSDYFFDRLFTEHKENRFAHLGMVYKAEQLEETGNSKKALTFYEQALHETHDVDVAAKAAFKLAQYHIEHGQAQKAKSYAQKIVDGAPHYFTENSDTSLDMARSFANRHEPQIAAAIAGNLLEKMDMGDVGYEELYKDHGIWLARAEEKAKALASFNSYLKKYQYGEYREEVIREKDALFFDNDDQNFTVKLAEYDKLIEQYPGDAIGNKAIYKKAQLLYAEGRYPQVLDMRSRLEALDPGVYTDTAQIIENAAVKMMERALEADACSDVVALSHEFEVKLSAQWDVGIYKCSIMSGEYELAKSMTLPHLKAEKVAERMAWLERYIHADFALGNYQDVIVASRELLELDKVEGNNYQHMQRIRFDAYWRLDDKNGMVATIRAIEQAFGLDFDDIERYTQMVTLAQEQNSDTQIESYANKVIALQQKTQTRTQSPYIEFTLAQAQISLDKTESALATLGTLDTIEISAEKRARQRYLEGSLLQKLSRSDDAKRAYEESMQADPDSAWSALSEESLKLLQ